MILTRLTLQNFRNVEYAEFDLTQSMFFLGMNGQGKSTILNAVQIALHGWCEHTDRRGAGYRDLIREGAKQAVVELEFTTPQMVNPHRICYTLGIVARQWDLVDLVTGEVREAIATPAALWASLKIDQTHATVCMFPTQIVNAPEFAGILSSYLADALKPELLAARIPEEHREALNALAARKHVALDSVTGYESLGKLCYEQRTLIIRDLKLVDAAIAETGFLKPVRSDGATLTVDNLPGLRDRLTRLESEAADLRTQLGRAQQAATAPVVDRAAVTATLEQHRATLAACDAARAAMHKDAEASHTLAVAKQAQSAALRNREKAEATRDALSTTCPTCKRKLTAAMLAEIRNDAQQAVDTALAVEQSADADVNAALIAWVAIEYVGDSSETLDARSAEAQRGIAEAEAALATPPAYTGPTVAQIEAQLTANGDSIAVTRQIIAALDQHRILAEAEAQAASLRAQLAPIAVGISEFHDGVAYRALLASAAGPIVEAVNERITGTLAVRAEGKAFVLLYNGRPLALASRGQRATVAYAMAETFASCGAPVLLDDTNDLDPLNRGALCMRVRQAATGTVLLAGTPNSVEPEYPARLAALLAPMRIVTVSDGQYRMQPVAMEGAA